MCVVLSIMAPGEQLDLKAVSSLAVIREFISTGAKEETLKAMMPFCANSKVSLDQSIYIYMVQSIPFVR